MNCEEYEQPENLNAQDQENVEESPIRASHHQVSFRPDFVETSGEGQPAKTAAFRSTGGVGSSLQPSEAATRIVSFDHKISQDSKSSACNVVYIAEESEESKLDDASGIERPQPMDLSSYLSGSGQAASSYDKNLSSHGPADQLGLAGRATSQTGHGRTQFANLVSDKDGSMIGSINLVRCIPNCGTSGQASCYSNTTVVFPKRQQTHSVLSHSQEPEGFDDVAQQRTIEANEQEEESPIQACLSPAVDASAVDLVKEQDASGESFKQMPPVAYCRSQDDIEDNLTQDNNHSMSDSRAPKLRRDTEPAHMTVSRNRKSKESYKDSLFSGNSDAAKSPVSAARGGLNRLRDKLTDQVMRLPEENEMSEMSTSQKHEYLISLQDELQNQQDREAKFRQLQEELEQLSRNYQAEKEQQKAELDERKLHLWILDDKCQQLKQTLELEQAQTQQQQSETESMRRAVDSKQSEIEECQREIDEVKEESEAIDNEKNTAAQREEALRSEGETLKEELEKEKTVTIGEYEKLAQAEQNLTSLEQKLIDAKRRLEEARERHRNQDTIIQAAGNELSRLEEENRDVDEVDDGRIEERDMLETQKSYLTKQINIHRRDIEAVKKKQEFDRDYIKYGEKNNIMLDEQCKKDEETLKKLLVERDTLTKSVHATSSINKYTSQKIKMLEDQISETEEKTVRLEELRDEQKQLYQNTSFVEDDRTKAILSCSKSRERDRKTSNDRQSANGNSASVAKRNTAVSPSNAMAPLQFDRVSAKAAPDRNGLSPNIQRRVEMKSATIEKENICDKPDMKILRKFLVAPKQRQEPPVVVNSGDDEMDHLTMDGDMTTLEKPQSFNKAEKRNVRGNSHIGKYIDSGPTIIVSARDHVSVKTSERAKDMPRQCRLKKFIPSGGPSAEVTNRAPSAERVPAADAPTPVNHTTNSTQKTTQQDNRTGDLRAFLTNKSIDKTVVAAVNQKQQVDDERHDQPMARRQALWKFLDIVHRTSQNQTINNDQKSEQDHQRAVNNSLLSASQPPARMNDSRDSHQRNYSQEQTRRRVGGLSERELGRSQEREAIMKRTKELLERSRLRLNKKFHLVASRNNESRDHDSSIAESKSVEVPHQQRRILSHERHQSDAPAAEGNRFKRNGAAVKLTDAMLESRNSQPVPRQNTYVNFIDGPGMDDSSPHAKPKGDVVNYGRDMKHYDLPRLYTEKISAQRSQERTNAFKVVEQQAPTSMRTDNGAIGNTSGTYKSKAAQRVLSQMKERAKSQDRIRGEQPFTDVNTFNYKPINKGDDGKARARDPAPEYNSFQRGTSPQLPSLNNSTVVESAAGLNVAPQLTQIQSQKMLANGRFKAPIRNSQERESRRSVSLGRDTNNEYQSSNQQNNEPQTSRNIRFSQISGYAGNRTQLNDSDINDRDVSAGRKSQSEVQSSYIFSGRPDMSRQIGTAAYNTPHDYIKQQSVMSHATIYKSSAVSNYYVTNQQDGKQQPREFFSELKHDEVMSSVGKPTERSAAAAPMQYRSKFARKTLEQQQHLAKSAKSDQSKPQTRVFSPRPTHSQQVNTSVAVDSTARGSVYGHAPKQGGAVNLTQLANVQPRTYHYHLPVPSQFNQMQRTPEQMPQVASETYLDTREDRNEFTVQRIQGLHDRLEGTGTMTLLDEVPKVQSPASIATQPRECTVQSAHNLFNSGARYMSRPTTEKETPHYAAKAFDSTKGGGIVSMLGSGDAKFVSQFRMTGRLSSQERDQGSVLREERREQPETYNGMTRAPTAPVRSLNQSCMMMDQNQDQSMYRVNNIYSQMQHPLEPSKSDEPMQHGGLSRNRTGTNYGSNGLSLGGPHAVGSRPAVGLSHAASMGNGQDLNNSVPSGVVSHSASIDVYAADANKTQHRAKSSAALSQSDGEQSVRIHHVYERCNEASALVNALVKQQEQNQRKQKLSQYLQPQVNTFFEALHEPQSAALFSDYGGVIYDKSAGLNGRAEPASAALTVATTHQKMPSITVNETLQLPNIPQLNDRNSSLQQIQSKQYIDTAQSVTKKMGGGESITPIAVIDQQAHMSDNDSNHIFFPPSTKSQQHANFIKQEDQMTMTTMQTRRVDAIVTQVIRANEPCINVSPLPTMTSQMQAAESVNQQQCHQTIDGASSVLNRDSVLTASQMDNHSQTWKQPAPFEYNMQYQHSSALQHDQRKQTPGLVSGRDEARMQTQMTGESIGVGLLGNQDLNVKARNHALDKNKMNAGVRRQVTTESNKDFGFDSCYLSLKDQQDIINQLRFSKKNQENRKMTGAPY